MIEFFKPENFIKIMEKLVTEPVIESSEDLRNAPNGAQINSIARYTVGGNLTVESDITVAFVLVKKLKGTKVNGQVERNHITENHCMVVLSKGDVEELLMLDGIFYKSNAVIEDAHFVFSELYRMFAFDKDREEGSGVRELLETLGITEIPELFGETLANDYPPTDAPLVLGIR